MLQIVLGIAILVISLGVVYGGYRYAQIGKVKFADAGVKVILVGHRLRMDLHQE
ncbi:hypothetical protein [Pediococcus ethanolidurans]|uniref:Uncharacterized protein n=1 Tax=Pediococcus ethanolidurans TaxID=319653 RepID=A0A0R2K9L4_9LACO|nr:hypothetical protein [Pediococcus ethanolidurans]KRN82980.1 hypothetical protein IV87_GL001687 [Pediococcus ethanolidurans]GEN94131.1 hypothetical protein PET01_01810 [Pediococcus ethanolidurans]SER06222.1 hypothetical protein SAMN04487973_101184 [Pediococcus ethanolidurans]